jgi:hypothetical protein
MQIGLGSRCVRHAVERHCTTAESAYGHVIAAPVTKKCCCSVCVWWCQLGGWVGGCRPCCYWLARNLVTILAPCWLVSKAELRLMQDSDCVMLHPFAVCKAGHQPSPDDDGSCEVCKEGTFKAHKGNKKCEECPWPKTTEHRGALTPEACGETAGLIQIYAGVHSAFTLSCSTGAVRCCTSPCCACCTVLYQGFPDPKFTLDSAAAPKLQTACTPHSNSVVTQCV